MLFCLLLLLAFFGETLSGAAGNVTCISGTYGTSSPGSLSGCFSCLFFALDEYEASASCESISLQQCVDRYGDSDKRSFSHLFTKKSAAKVYCCDTNNCNDANLFQPAYSSKQCALQTSCNSCLYGSNEQFPCIWQADTRQCYSNSSLPATVDSNYTKQLPYNLYSTIPFTPNEVLEISLIPGRNTEIYLNDASFTTTIKGNNFDIFLLVDASDTMATSITTLTNNINNLATEISNEFPGAVVRFGLGSFLDIPQQPFGQDPSEWLFRVEAQITSNYSEVVSAFNDLSTRLSSRKFTPAASFSALFYAANRDAAIADGSFVPGVQPTPISIGWGTGNNKAIMLFTDSTSHIPGEANISGIFKPNNLDANMDGNPSGTAEEYISFVEVINALVVNDIYLFVGAIDCVSVSSCSSSEGKGSFWSGSITDFYQDNFPTTVFDASALSLGTDLSSQIAASFKTTLNGSIAVSVVSDPLLRISIMETGFLFTSSGFGLQFDVFLYNPQNSDNTFINGTSVIHVLNYGDIILHTYVPQLCDFSCFSESTNFTCMGCNDIVQVNDGIRPVYDSCGVCGGLDGTCTGCDGGTTTNDSDMPAKVYDGCGICGGDNSTCAGCEGIPNSGTGSNICGLCNVSDSACTDDWSAVGIAGVVVFITGALFILLVFLLASLSQLKLNSMEAKLQKNPLCKEAKQRIK